MTVSVAATSSRMGRPPLSQKSETRPTMVRLTAHVRERIVSLVGAMGMAAYIREAVEQRLQRDEEARERTKTKPD